MDREAATSLATDIGVGAGSGGGGGGENVASQPKKLKLSAAANIIVYCLPDTMLTFIIGYLSMPSRALFAVALDGGNNKESRSNSLVV